MKIYYLHKDLQKDFTCLLTTQMIDVFVSEGCIALTETEFQSNSFTVNDDDIIIVYISVKDQLTHDKLKMLKCRKILQSLDESKSDQKLFRTQIEFCKKHEVNTIINAFPSTRNLEFLGQNGIKTITLPFSAKSRTVSFDHKTIDVLVSGQIDQQYYPIRSKIFNALRSSNIKFAILPHCGMDISNASHQYHGEKFNNLLDTCWMGVTCRAGERDRLVPKYIEFGFSKVLPIGDHPTYMNDEMKSSMLIVNMDDSPDEIIQRINYLVSNKDILIDRIEKYSKSVNENYEINANVNRTISMIKNNMYDSVPT